jgi:hypothetical protein
MSLFPDITQGLQPQGGELPHSWRVVSKAHHALVALADKHYTRQKPGTPLCTRPGVNLPMLTVDCLAGWIVWRPIPEVGRKDSLEAWEVTLFRNDGPALSSDLIRTATAMTFRQWGWPPRDGLITAVGVTATRRRRSKRSTPGACFLHAGWTMFDQRHNGDQVWLRAPHPQRADPKEG